VASRRPSLRHRALVAKGKGDNLLKDVHIRHACGINLNWGISPKGPQGR
jgi:hypothetical protein